MHVTLLGFEDRLAPGSAAAVADLQQGTWRRGTRIVQDMKQLVMLTGRWQEGFIPIWMKACFPTFHILLGFVSRRHYRCISIDGGRMLLGLHTM